jgi:BlaI family penicillinase repressor
MLRYLEEKGRVRHEQDGPRYVYLPSIAKASARRSALGHLLNTFFDDSVTSMVATLLESRSLSREEHARLSKLVDSAFREKGRK